ncbi:MAG: hypothetical protein IT581_07790 [Verrucomicrobiales bacterium]|nr:hypothetical protein [Verrucomicrobiales bacterium]
MKLLQNPFVTIGLIVAVVGMAFRLGASRGSTDLGSGFTVEPAGWWMFPDFNRAQHHVWWTAMDVPAEAIGAGLRSESASLPVMNLITSIPRN